jgi:hypothetical protein
MEFADGAPTGIASDGEEKRMLAVLVYIVQCCI